MVHKLNSVNALKPRLKKKKKKSSVCPLLSTFVSVADVQREKAWALLSVTKTLLTLLDEYATM